MRQKVDGVNEGQSSTVYFDLFDQNGTEATPTSARYKIGNPTSGATVADWAIGTIDNETVACAISAASNTPSGDDDEMREVTLEATYAGGEKFVDSAVYVLQAARFWP